MLEFFVVLAVVMIGMPWAEVVLDRLSINPFRWYGRYVMWVLRRGRDS